MAAINTLREKAGKIMVFVIGFSIVAFVGADLLGPNSAILGGDNYVGEVAGTDVTYQEFLDKRDEIEYNWRQNNQRIPAREDMNTINIITWNTLVAELAFGTEYADLGMSVPEEEIIDMVQGDHISPQIKQAFTDPKTGRFDKNKVVTYLQNLSEAPPAQRAAWYNFERSLAPTRLRAKFDNLIVDTDYATTQEGKNQYESEVSTVDISYLYVPFSSIADSTVEVTNGELEDYLALHQEEYQREPSVTLKYVSYNIIPSAADTALVVEEMKKKAAGLAAAENDSVYATLNSEVVDAFKAYTPGELPETFTKQGVALEEGAMLAPALDDNSYVVYKISEVTSGEKYAARASHILFKWADESDAEKTKAKKEAEKVLRKIRGGADFAEMARFYGTDGTASKGGDLGWFSDGAMVKSFEEAVYGTQTEGLLSKVVESPFGYHVIKVTEPKTNTVYKIAKIGLEVFPTDATRNTYYRKAEKLAVSSTDLASFEKHAEEGGRVVKVAENIGRNDTRMSDIAQARSIIHWAYKTAAIGEVSEVFETDSQYVIVALIAKQAKGTAELDGVRMQITTKVKDDKKTDLIIKKLEGTSGSLSERAASYGENVETYDMPALRLSSNSLNTVGVAPKAVGTAFSMESGEMTQPFAVENGVIILVLNDKQEAPALSDYQSYRKQIEQRRQGGLSYKITQAVEKLAGVVDNRYRFF